MLNQLRSLANSRSEYHNLPASLPQLQVIGSLMSEYSERDERLMLLSQWFGRPILSSKELTKSEAASIIELAFYKDWEPQEKFIKFIEDSKVSLYDF